MALMKKSLWLSGLLLCSCHYSFTGAIIAPEIKKVYVANFENQAPVVIPGLDQQLAELLRDVIITQSSLTLANRASEADVCFYGTITGYEIVPVSIAAGDQTQQNRLKITLIVRYENRHNEAENWEQTFSNFADFDASVNISTIQDQLIETIGKKIAQDVFNKAFSQW